MIYSTVVGFMDHPEDATDFGRRVTERLASGWDLLGAPTVVQTAAKNIMIVQAIISSAPPRTGYQTGA